MVTVIRMVSGMSQKPKTVKASEFKARCLALLNEVARTGETIVITKNGKPIVDLVPHRARKRSARNALGILKGQVEIIGDIVSPIYAEWAQDIDAELKKRRARDD